MLRIMGVFAVLFSSFFTTPVIAQALERPVMDNARLESIIARIDENYQGTDGRWSFQLEGVSLQIVTDERANRMRIFAPIIKAESIDRDKLYRMMQANFDSTLDARYAIAQGMLWGTFIHPLASLTDQDFLSGVGQTANIVISYGSSYSSGSFVFGGGDSNEIQQQILERLKRLSETI